MRKILMTLLLVGALGGLAGCGDDDDTGNGAGKAYVRVAHLSPDAPNVDVRVDGNKVLSDVPFKAVSDYLELAGGAHRIQVTPANVATPVVIDANVTLAGGTSYTVAAVGQLGNGTLQPLVLTDDRSPAAGQAKVRFVHAAPDAPAVDVGVAGGANVFTNKAFKEFTGYAALPAATYNLAVKPAGTLTVALSVPNVAVSSGYNYTIFAVGLLGDGTLAALPVVDYRP